MKLFNILKRLGLSDRETIELKRIIQGQNVAINNLTKQIDDLKKKVANSEVETFTITDKNGNEVNISKNDYFLFTRNVIGNKSYLNVYIINDFTKCRTPDDGIKIDIEIIKTSENYFKTPDKRLNIILKCLTTNNVISFDSRWKRYYNTDTMYYKFINIEEYNFIELQLKWNDSEQAQNYKYIAE